MKRMRHLLGDYFQVSLPHVAANKLQLCTALFAQETKKAKQRLGCSIRTDPEQTLAPFVDLVDERLVFVAPMPLHLVDPDGLDIVQVAVLQTPRNSVFNGLVDTLPANAEGYGNFFPGHASRPPC